MGKIIQDEDEAIQATLDDLKLKKPPMRRILEVYATNSINFQADNFDLAHITDSFYQKITGKSIRELRKDSNIKTSVFHSLSDIQKEKFERLADIIQSISDNFLEENRLMSMDDWKNVFIHL